MESFVLAAISSISAAVLQSSFQGVGDVITYSPEEASSSDVAHIRMFVKVFMQKFLKESPLKSNVLDQIVLSHDALHF
ncbi:hypothetical protein N0V92_005718 [Colletotrichum tropicale]|nr:hypothetical protein N0V92_005718 [Colletotrichum tropicale]